MIFLAGAIVTNKERPVEKRQLSCSLEQRRERRAATRHESWYNLPFGHRDTLLSDIEDEEAADSKERRVLFDFCIKSVVTKQVSVVS